MSSPPPPSPTNTAASGGRGGSSVSPSVFIIAAVVAVAIVIILAIHRLIRLFFRSAHLSSHHHLPTSGRRRGAAGAGMSEREKAKLIESLPIITLGNSLMSLPKSPVDCAVCCEPFSPEVELRFLPACRHAFHKHCVDPWLRSNPSCPLCRSSIGLPHPPLPDPSSGSFRLEIGSVSRRRSLTEPETQTPPNQNQTQTRTPNQNQTRPPNQNRTQIRPATTPPSLTDSPLPLPPPPPPPPFLRSYSMDSYYYCIEDEVEVIPRVPKEQNSAAMATTRPEPPSPPREEQGRGWLQDYVDRLATSASSSFNSLRFSQRSGRWSTRSSQRFDAGGGGAQPDTWWWDLEGNQQSEEMGVLHSLYRWLTGV